MNWFYIRFGLFVLLIFCHSCRLAAAAAQDDESVPSQQIVKRQEEGRARGNEASRIINQLRRQPLSSSFVPSISYDPFKSVSHNIGYNFGRNLGRTPFAGAPLDSQAEASKVVLVLANDKPEKREKTVQVPQATEETLKRMVRNPDFFQDFVDQMNSINQQLSLRVPELSRTMGEGFNEMMSSTPLGPVHEAGGIDYAKLGQTFGESILPENVLAGMGDAFSITLPPMDSQTTPTPPPPPPPPPQSPMTETEQVESELAPKRSNDQVPGLPFDSSALLDSPLFRSLQQFVPSTFSPASAPSSERSGAGSFMFNPSQYLSWLQNSNPESAASDISEVRVKPDMPFRISPKGASQKMSEMKLRAAMREALTKKTIPILWFRLAEKNARDSSSSPFSTTSDETKSDKPLAVTDEDLKMQMKLASFERQLIEELQQLQEVVKLANALKKAQLEAKGRKAEDHPSLKPLTLSSTPLYKITLADIEKTLKDEYVQKLLQMASNAKKRDQMLRNKSANGKYNSDFLGNPNKRQTPGASSINKDELLQMMAYAYRMAASNGQDMSWLKENNAQNMNDSSKASQMTNPVQQAEPRQQTMSSDEQWLAEKQQMQQQQMSMESNERIPGDVRQYGPYGSSYSHYDSFGGYPGGYGRPSQFGRPPAAHFVHHHHIGRTDTNNMQMPDMMTSNGQQPGALPMPPMQQQEQQRQATGSTGSQDIQEQVSQQQMTQDQQIRQLTQDQQQMQNIPLTGQSQTMTGPMTPTQREWFYGRSSEGTAENINQMNMAQQPTATNNNPSGISNTQQMREQQQSPGAQSNISSDQQTQQMRQNFNALAEQMANMGNPSTLSNPSIDMSRQILQQQQQQRQMANVPSQTPLQMPEANNPSAATGQTTSLESAAPLQRQSTATQPAGNLDQSAISAMTNGKRQMAQTDAAMPIEGEATPQMPENAGMARHKGFDDFFDSLDPRGGDDKKHKNKGKGDAPIINYYYNAGGASVRPPAYGYAPAAPAYGYGGGYARPPPPPPAYGGGAYAPAKPKPSSYYGGGAYGSNAYGSGGYYRTATGDAEIEEMLREHQTMPHFSFSAPDAVLALPPIASKTTSTNNNINCSSSSSPKTSITDDEFQKMILLTRPDDNRIRTTSTSSLDDTSSGNADLKNQTKRLASNDFANYKSFLIVVRPGKKTSKRSKRSAAYTALEPIDENSLSELRKTYKNSLKEITLNPNETPEQALERYNAEAIREALAKANATPMEISAGEDTAEIDDKGEHQDQYVAESGYMSASPKSHKEEENHVGTQAHSSASATVNSGGPQYNQYVAHSAGVSQSAAAGAVQNHEVPQNLHTYQVKPSINPHQHQHQQHHQHLSQQTPYVSVVNPYEPVAVVDDYDINPNAYPAVSNRNGFYRAIHPGKPLPYAVPYAKPELSYSTTPLQAALAVKLPTLPNPMAGNLVRLYEPNRYGVRLSPPVAKPPSCNAIEKSARISYSDLNPQHNKPTKSCDKSIENIYEILKQRLSDCCSECKEKLLKTLEEALKHSDLGHTKDSDKKSYDTKTTTQTIRKEDEAKFKEWIDEMSQKGYDKNHLTKDLQRDYMVDGRFQLALPQTESSGELMYGSTQSFKRETTLSEHDVDLMTPQPQNENSPEGYEEETDEESSGAESDMTQEAANNIKEEITKGDDVSPQTSNLLEPAESTTHSVYALRGKYKPNKRNHIPGTEDKHIARKYRNHRHVKKLGAAGSRSKPLVNAISKSLTQENGTEQHKNIEEILDFLHELSKVSKERQTKLSSEVASSTTTSPPLTSTTTEKPQTSTNSASPTSVKPKRRKSRLSSRPTKSALAKRGSSLPTEKSESNK